MHEGDCRYGLADDDVVTLMSGEPFASWESQGVIPLSEAHLMSPVTPTKVVGVGLNYRPHIAELGYEPPKEPVLSLIHISEPTRPY
jgi:2-keto-4-pentenoate hydratase/2-oxohepta-3-ene-1,7-dioic acid hydratase in catechol pathway